MSGFAALILCSLIFILWRLPWLMQSASVAGLIKAVFIYLLAITGLMAFSFVISAKGLTRRLPPDFPGRKLIVEFTEAYFRFVSSWRETSVASLLSVVMLLAYFLTFYFSARAFGLRVPVGEFFAFMPVVDVIAALPISLGGFGVREQLFATVLAELWNAPAAQAVSISLAGGSLALLWGLFGLALLPGYHHALGRAVRA
jgi:glycosyltransferase 2 family protein